MQATVEKVAAKKVCLVSCQLPTHPGSTSWWVYDWINRWSRAASSGHSFIVCAFGVWIFMWTGNETGCIVERIAHLSMEGPRFNESTWFKATSSVKIIHEITSCDHVRSIQLHFWRHEQCVVKLLSISIFTIRCSASGYSSLIVINHGSQTVGQLFDGNDSEPCTSVWGTSTRHRFNIIGSHKFTNWIHDSPVCAATHSLWVARIGTSSVRLIRIIRWNGSTCHEDLPHASAARSQLPQYSFS